MLFLAHWDHFGTCAEPPAEDLICNGAIDNASGLAALTEIARRLASGPQLDRDVYFLATTAEELGLLGAHAFAENPPLPLKQIVAAFNIDSPALAPPGTPLAIVGHGMTAARRRNRRGRQAQKRQIASKRRGRTLPPRRQDGWALLQHDIPAVMVTWPIGPGPGRTFMETTTTVPATSSSPARTGRRGAGRRVLRRAGALVRPVPAATRGGAG